MKAKEWNRRDVAPLGKRLYRRLATGFAFLFHATPADDEDENA
jgi:hypothetical protein